MYPLDRLVGPACCMSLAVILSTSAVHPRSPDPAPTGAAVATQPSKSPAALSAWVPLHRLAPGAALVTFTAPAPRLVAIFLSKPAQRLVARHPDVFGPPSREALASWDRAAPAVAADLASWATAQEADAAAADEPSSAHAAGAAEAPPVAPSAVASEPQTPIVAAGEGPFSPTPADPAPAEPAAAGGTAVVTPPTEPVTVAGSETTTGTSPADSIDAAVSASALAEAQSGVEASAARTETNAAQQVQLELLHAINGRRASAGLPPLQMDQRLVASATEHSRDMAARGYCRHRGSDGSSARARMARHGYPYNNWAGENIICSRRSVESAMQWWMGSRPHRKNILHSHFTHIGIGVDPNAPYGGYMFTLNFAAGATDTVQPSVFNDADTSGEAGAPEEQGAGG